MQIILASQSPRRRELLSQVGVSFTVEVSDTEEKICGDDPAGIVQNLARQKAEAVHAKHADEDVLVIGADTIVVYAGDILGKPKDPDDARRMLRELSGKVHQVYTGVCVIRPAEGSGSVAGIVQTGSDPGQETAETESMQETAKTESMQETAKTESMQRNTKTESAVDTFAECTDVFVAPLSDVDIDAYIATGEPFDKAGGYGIQGVFARHIEKIEGDYFNVVGLPVGRLWREYLHVK